MVTDKQMKIKNINRLKYLQSTSDIDKRKMIEKGRSHLISIPANAIQCRRKRRRLVLILGTQYKIARMRRERERERDIITTEKMERKEGGRDEI